MPRADRPFDRIDAAALLVAAAAGLALAYNEAALRSADWPEIRAEEPAPGPALYLVDASCRVAGRLVAPLCLATLLARLRRRGPRPGRILDRPGTWPGLACAVILATNLLVEPLNLAALHTPPSWPKYLRYRYDNFDEEPIGVVVSVAWAMLALCGRWRPERSWVDRAGRALGIAAIALFLASASETGIDNLIRERPAAERAAAPGDDTDPAAPKDAGRETPGGD